MNTVVIPGARIGSMAEFHDFMSKALDFGPYYGNNLDALWDRLTTDVERPLRIVWEGSTVSRERLGDEIFEKVARLLREAQAEVAGRPGSDGLIVEFRN